MSAKKGGASPQALLEQRLGQDVRIAHVGRVVYTARAFAQDAQQAIANDPYRALVEALTNSDDNLGNRDGTIEIGVRGGNRPWMLTVGDNGDGIAPGDIEEKLVKLGSRTSGLERGESARGNRGRGARDLASLGNVLFETVHNGWYSTLMLDASGELAAGEPRKATPAQRKRCRIDRNGTRVTIECNTAKKPQAPTMARKLQSLVALRDIMQNPKRRITLCYGGNPPVRLRYVPPKDRKPIGKWAFAVPGYHGKASLALFQLPRALDEDPRDIAREGGILLKGGRAVHESTLFDYEGNPAAKRIVGELRWDELDDLIRTYDDEEEQGRPHGERNPFPIVRRSRDGLDPTHPAYKALKLAAQKIVGPEVKRLEQEASRGAVQESDETRKRFSALGDLLGKFWKSKREELDDDDAGGSGAGEPELQPGLTVAPPRKRLDPGTSATFSVRLVSSDECEPAMADLSIVEAAPNDAIALSCATLQLRGARESGFHVYRGSFRVNAGRDVGEALVEACCAGMTADLDVRVATDLGHVPTTLEFEHDRYRLRPGKPKKVRLLAPHWLVLAEGDAVTVRSSAPDDIAVRKSDLLLKPCGSYYMTEAVLYGEELDAKASISAELGKIVAVARAVVAEEHRPRVQVTIDAIPGNQRAQVRKSERGDVLITINGTHGAAKRYLGEHPKYPLQNTVPARVLLADIAGEEMVQFFLAEKYRAREVDPTTLQAQRIRELAELMAKIHLIMLPDGELRRNQHASAESELRLSL